MKNVKAGIIGATGFTGSELVRILHHHPSTELEFITSESRAGEKFSDVHPFFAGIEDMVLHSIQDLAKFDPDVVFLALPHGVSMEFVKAHMEMSFRIIDLSGDFRLSSAAEYLQWYKQEHIFPEGIDKAVFGLPELFREEIRKAGLIANPGCYPTSAILASAPLVQKGMIETGGIIIDSKSGVTGAGVKAKAVNMFSNVNENFRAYGLKKHRHTIEIESTLNALSSQEVRIQFTPHLLPVDRGILSTSYLKPTVPVSQEDLKALYTDFYRDCPFVRVRNQLPGIKDVRGTNYCDLYADYDPRTGRIIIITVIDNLVKGAAGQAVQNMNLMFDLEEETGLKQIPLEP